MPHDPFHLFVLGLLLKFLSFFAASLTDAALLELSWLLTQAKPHNWCGLNGFELSTSQKDHRKKLKGSGEDLRRQIQAHITFLCGNCVCAWCVHMPVCTLCVVGRCSRLWCLSGSLLTNCGTLSKKT